MPNKRVVLIGLLAAILIFSEVIGPFAISFWLDRALFQVMPSKQHTVSARSFPGLFVWLGRFDSVNAVSETATIDGLNIQEAKVVIGDARLNMSQLIARNKIQVDQVRDLQITLKVSEKDLAEYLGSKVKEVKNPSVKILKDKIEIRGDVDLGILKLAVGVDGRIVGDASSIRFRSDRLEVKNAGGLNFGALFAEIPLLDLTKLPFKVAVRKIVTDAGVITVYADNH